MRTLAHTAVTAHATTADEHQSSCKRRPTTGCCVRLLRAWVDLQDKYAQGRRCRSPVAALVRGSQILCISRKCTAHMGTRGTSEIDHGYNQVSSNGAHEGARQGRQRRIRWQRGGGEACRVPEGFLEYHLGRNQKERTYEVARSSEAEKLDVMVMHDLGTV